VLRDTWTADPNNLPNIPFPIPIVLVRLRTSYALVLNVTLGQVLSANDPTTDVIEVAFFGC
jgi:hypothetical protein